MWGHSPGAGSEALLCQRTGKGADRSSFICQAFKREEEVNFIRADFLFLYSLVLITCIMLPFAIKGDFLIKKKDAYSLEGKL